MVRGLDGFFDQGGTRVALCSFEGPGGEVSRNFPVALARGKHLFPFRTEQLSPSALMVLGPHGPGRVGRRRFFLKGPPKGGPFCTPSSFGRHCTACSSRLCDAVVAGLHGG